MSALLSRRIAATLPSKNPRIKPTINASHITAPFSMKKLLFSIFCLLFALPALGQTVLMPMPRQCFQDVLSSGKPLAGGKIFTYQAGTSTPQATFTDATGLVANTNPVILDAAGCWTIWLTSGQAYRFVAQNSFGVQEWVTDQVSGLATVGSAFNQAITTVTFGATPTFTATGQFQVFKMTLTGNVTSSTLSMTGITTPGIVSFELTQDGIGGRTFTWPLNISGTTPINLTPSSVSTETFFWDGTTAWPWYSPLQQSTTVTFSATPTFTAWTQNTLFKMTLTGNVSSSTLVMTGLNAPSSVTFEITQDGTGGRTFVWPTNVLNPPTVAPGANTTTQASFFWDGTNLNPEPQALPLTTRITGADFTTASATLVTAITMGNMAANTNYSFDCWIGLQTSIASSASLGLGGPSSPTSVNAVIDPGNGVATAGPAAIATISAFASSVSVGTLSATSTTYSVRVWGTIENGANAGNLTLQTDASGGATITIKRGSFCTLLP